MCYECPDPEEAPFMCLEHVEKFQAALMHASEHRHNLLGRMLKKKVFYTLPGCPIDS